LFQLHISDGVKGTSLKAKAKAKDFKIVEDEDLSSRIPTLLHMWVNVRKTPTKRRQNGCHGNTGCLATGSGNLQFMAVYFNNSKAYKL